MVKHHNILHSPAIATDPEIGKWSTENVRKIVLQKNVAAGESLANIVQYLLHSTIHLTMVGVGKPDVNGLATHHHWNHVKFLDKNPSGSLLLGK